MIYFLILNKLFLDNPEYKSFKQLKLGKVQQSLYMPGQTLRVQEG
jgi:hypothetical protein